MRDDDQASGLRRLFGRRTRRLLGIGGLDATPFAADLARALGDIGSRVLMIDRSRGELASRAGARARWELAHVVSGDRAMADVLIDLPGDVTILPAARGLDELALGCDDADGGWPERLAAWLADAGREFDVWLVNGLPPSGSHADVLLAIQPTAAGITGAYAQIKALAQCRGLTSFGIVVRTESEALANVTFASVAETARRFLAARLDHCATVGDRDAPPRRLALLRLAESLVAQPALT
jgi:flagellar biosynthesis protein FlhG